MTINPADTTDTMTISPGDTFTPRPRADIAADLRTALAVSANDRFTVRHTSPNEPFYYLGDTAWELFHRLDRAEAELYLRNRAAKGFNSIMVVVMAEHGGLDFPNRAGAWPFHPATSSKDYVPDMARPNPAYFDFVDEVVGLASQLDMTISLVPTWGRYINGGYYGSPILFDEENARSFGRFLGERYPFHPFILGGDSNRHWNPEFNAVRNAGRDVSELPLIDYGVITEAMAAGLRDGEAAAIAALDADLKAQAEGYETFITFHSAQVWHPKGIETTASAQFPDADWLSFDCMQTGHYDGPMPERAGGGTESAQLGVTDSLWYSKSSYIPMRKMYAARRRDGRPRPVLDLEAHYESAHHWFSEKYPLWTADDIRNGMWQGLFAGACGYTYGVNSIWQMHNAASVSHPPIAPPTTATVDWFLELDLPGAWYSSVAKNILLDLPCYFSRVPDQSFIVSDTGEREGERAGDTLVSGMRADDWAAVHLPYGGTVQVDLALAIPSAKGWKAWWVDPRCGGREVFETGNNLGVRAFSAPSAGTLSDDWILLLSVDPYPL
ncbi:hypothetical protein CcaverHIS002_0211670 [Cutaneotrichosporon cavernicola]|nr:hypothetical protein CcaverHIS002_0211670 [Cutaneotrichosporon cavernicola]